MELFSEETRRDPYPLYERMCAGCPVRRAPGSDVWMVFDYSGVKRVLSDHEAFSSNRSGSNSQPLIFLDPPRHTRLRALISRAFTPRVIRYLEARIRELTSELLDRMLGPENEGEPRTVDLAEAFSVPLPMMVTAEMIGAPSADWPRYKRWAEALLKLTHTTPGAESEEAARALSESRAVVAEMRAYLPRLVEQRREEPRTDLLARLLDAELEGERLTEEEILFFFQLLLIAGTETSTDLINNALLCFIRYPDQLARLRAAPDLLPSAIEEVLRFRSPLQWMWRTTRRDVEMHGQAIPARAMVLAVMGSANRDAREFADADRFDIARDPNPHLAFGHGIHFCLGAPLSRLEVRIALAGFLERAARFELATDQPLTPRTALHVHGPVNLPLRLEPRSRAAGNPALPPRRA